MKSCGDRTLYIQELPKTFSKILKCKHIHIDEIWYTVDTQTKKKLLHVTQGQFLFHIQLHTTWNTSQIHWVDWHIHRMTRQPQHIFTSSYHRTLDEH